MFKYTLNEQNFEIIVPSYRNDIEIKEDIVEEKTWDADVIASKAASILSGTEEVTEETPVVLDDDEDFISRIQKKLESNYSPSVPLMREDIENRMRMVEPDAVAAEEETVHEESDEIISDERDHSMMNRFFEEFNFDESPDTLITLDDDDDGEEEPTDDSYEDDEDYDEDEEEE